MARTGLVIAMGMLFAAVSLLELRAEGSPQGIVQDPLSHYGYNQVRPGKYAAVINGYSTWQGALNSCQSHGQAATLFIVNNPQDSQWLGETINHIKDRVNGASKFWVGLTSRSPSGPLVWLDGTGYQQHVEVVKADGYDDETKKYAWAVPDSGRRLKYEFLTADDEAEAFICQYIS